MIAPPWTSLRRHVGGREDAAGRRQGRCRCQPHQSSSAPAPPAARSATARFKDEERPPRCAATQDGLILHDGRKTPSHPNYTAESLFQVIDVPSYVLPGYEEPLGGYRCTRCGLREGQLGGKQAKAWAQRV